MRRCIAGLLLFAACADETPENLIGTPRDDRLALTGKVCSAAPEMPSFPLRLIFVVDISGGTQFTDNMRLRQTALQSAIGAYLGAPEAQVDIIVFNEAVLDLTNGYTRDPALIQHAIDLLSTADGGSDLLAA